MQGITSRTAPSIRRCFRPPLHLQRLHLQLRHLLLRSAPRRASFSWRVVRIPLWHPAFNHPAPNECHVAPSTIARSPAANGVVVVLPRQLPQLSPASFCQGLLSSCRPCIEQKIVRLAHEHHVSASVKHKGSMKEVRNAEEEAKGAS